MRLLFTLLVLSFTTTSIACDFKQADKLFEQRHQSKVGLKSILKMKKLLELCHKTLVDQANAKVSNQDVVNSWAQDRNDNPFSMIKNYDLLWRMSRANFYTAVHVYEGVKDLNDVKPLHKEGYQQAAAATLLEANKPEALYYYALNAGRYGEIKGVMESLSLLSPIKKALNKLIKIDSQYDGGGGHRILGRVYYTLPGLIGGSNSKALNHYNLAISSNGGKTQMVNYRFRGELHYLMGKKDKAIVDFNLAMKVYEEDVKQRTKGRVVASENRIQFASMENKREYKKLLDRKSRLKL